MYCRAKFFEKIIKDTGDAEAELSPEMKAAVDMLKKEQARVIKAFEKVLDATEIKHGKEVKTAQRGEVLKSSKESVITREDVKIIQSIGRKSINELTEAELKILEPIAKKYWDGLAENVKIKSPFFRRWFGDWRAEDNSNVSKVNLRVLTGTKKGNVVNNDTGFDINVSNIGIHHIEKHLHNSEFSKYVISHLDEITKNAVLLDTSISEKSSNTKHSNTMLMHSFYSVVDYNGEKIIVKLFVEEFYNDWNKSIQRRDYDLSKIKIITDGTKVRENNLTPLDAFDDDYNITVSDLFQLVKTYDKDFKPVPSSLAVNEDGTPKVVYHGTSEKFTEFDITKSRSWDRVPDYDLPGFYFSENIDEGMSYGDTKKFYIKITKPYEGDVYSLAKEKGSFRDAYEYLVKEGYDGLIVDDMGEGFAEYIVLKSNNIKSVENGGTFSSWDNDIMKSKPETDTESEVSKASISIPPVLNLDADVQAKINELVERCCTIKYINTKKNDHSIGIVVLFWSC
ncbi:MAG: hypothetical protein II998_12425 [Clostridia bacterium]|nr:hypothetical protein [Clostridia bacterium]